MEAVAWTSSSGAFLVAEHQKRVRWGRGRRVGGLEVGGRCPRVARVAGVETPGRVLCIPYEGVVIRLGKSQRAVVIRWGIGRRALQ